MQHQCMLFNVFDELKNIPTEPKTFADLIIPINFQNTITNQKFLLYDNNNHRRRLLIVARKEQLDFLNSCDGTFAVSIQGI